MKLPQKQKLNLCDFFTWVVANEESTWKEANVFPSIGELTHYNYYETASSLVSGTREGTIVLNFHSLSSFPSQVFLLSTT